MGTFRRAIQAAAVTGGLLLAVPVLVPTSSPLSAQDRRDEGRRREGRRGPNADALRLVSQTRADVRAAERSAPRFGRRDGKQRERFQNAERHLAEFEQRLSRGRFDKDVLDSAIGDVQHILDNNRLAEQDRDILSRDVNDLREMRRRLG